MGKGKQTRLEEEEAAKSGDRRRLRTSDRKKEWPVRNDRRLT